MGLLRKAGSIFDRLIDVQGFLAASMLLFMMLITCYEVIARYIFGTASAWVLEVCEYMLLYVTFLGATWLLRRDGHVKVDVVWARFGPKSKRVLTLMSCFTAAWATLVVAWFGATSTWDHFQRHINVIQTLRIPKWILLLVIPMGSLMLFVQLLRQIHEHLGSRGSQGDRPKRD